MLDPTKNFAKVTVSTGYDASATTVVLTGGDGAKLPDPSTDGAYNVVWFNSTDYGDPTDDTNKEIVRVTGRSTDTLTILRAQEDTSASVKNTGGKTYKMILAITQKMITDIAAKALSVKTVSGTIDGSNQTFTITSGYTGNSVISLAGQIFVEGVDYTTSSTTITYTSPPPAGYSGKTHVLICVS